MSFENFSSNDFSFLGFLIFPSGEIIEYGIAYDLHQKNASLELFNHRISVLKKMEERGYDIFSFQCDNIYFLAKKLIKESIITYINLDGTSKNIYVMLCVGNYVTLNQKETLLKLQSFFSRIDNFVVDFNGCPMEQSDFYHHLKHGIEKEKKLYFKRF